MAAEIRRTIPFHATTLLYYNRSFQYAKRRIIQYDGPTCNISLTSVRLDVMASDSWSNLSISSFLYNWLTSSLCICSCTKLTRKCMMAFGTASWMFFRIIKKYDRISLATRQKHLIRFVVNWTIIWYPRKCMWNSSLIEAVLLHQFA